MGQKNSIKKFFNIQNYNLIKKDKIHKILKKSVVIEKEEEKLGNINYIYNDNQWYIIVENNKEWNKEEDDFNYFEKNNYISCSNKNLEVKKKEIFPYSTIGCLKVKFPNSEDIYEYTCFLISKDIILTLASNLYNKEKGGKASWIRTSFSDEEIKWEKIYIQSKQENFTLKDNNNIKNNKKELDNKEEDLSKKLALIFQKINNKEWSGVILPKESNNIEDLENLFCAIFVMDIKTNSDSKEEIILGKVDVEDNNNPFIKVLNSGNEEDKKLIKRSPGCPIYRYEYYHSKEDVLGIINQNCELVYFDDEAALFISKWIRHILRFKDGIDMDNIMELKCADNDLGPADINYLSEFDLKNLKVLDLSGNSIKEEGAYCLSKAKFIFLEILNLNFNEIGDDGLYYISLVDYKFLKELHLFYNKISDKGIKDLVLSKFINNLEVLSLSENPEIKIAGAIIIKERKVWDKLCILHMNSTGLNDIALKALSEAFMPMLEILNIQGNSFGKEGKKIIEEMKKKNIKVKYIIEK